jgi:hypothetical protein
MNTHPFEAAQNPPSGGPGSAAAAAGVATGARVNAIEPSKSRSIPPSREPNHVNNHQVERRITLHLVAEAALQLRRWQVESIEPFKSRSLPPK